MENVKRNTYAPVFGSIIGILIGLLVGYLLWKPGSVDLEYVDPKISIKFFEDLTNTKKMGKVKQAKALESLKAYRRNLAMAHLAFYPGRKASGVIHTIEDLDSLVANLKAFRDAHSGI